MKTSQTIYIKMQQPHEEITENSLIERQNIKKTIYPEKPFPTINQ